MVDRSVTMCNQRTMDNWNNVVNPRINMSPFAELGGRNCPPFVGIQLVGGVTNICFRGVETTNQTISFILYIITDWILHGYMLSKL